MIRRGVTMLAAGLMLLLAGGAWAATSQTLFAGFQSGNRDPVQVEADSLEVTEGQVERVSVFRGNVTVTRGDTVLRAAVITIYSDAGQPADDAEPFNRIEASGKVYVSSGEDQTATGDAASLDMKTRTVVLTGNVVLTQGTNVLTGDKLTVDIASGKARIEQTSGGRIRGVFTPTSGNSGQ
jgi:lipopolysaccharide export system protein LptA